MQEECVRVSQTQNQAVRLSLEYCSSGLLSQFSGNSQLEKLDEISEISAWRHCWQDRGNRLWVCFPKEGQPSSWQDRNHISPLLVCTLLGHSDSHPEPKLAGLPRNCSLSEGSTPKLGHSDTSLPVSWQRHTYYSLWKDNARQQVFLKYLHKYNFWHTSKNMQAQQDNINKSQQKAMWEPKLPLTFC